MPSASSVQAADFADWKTLGDALATQTAQMSSGWNDEYYVTVFESGDSIVRVVAKIDEETNTKLNEVDWSKDNVSEQIEKAASGAEIVSIEDLTSERMSQEALDKLAGKTGKDLANEGWVFERYFMYGGERTGVTFAKGRLAYMITFDVSIAEGEIEDGGSAVMDATIVEAVFEGASNDATDPLKVE